MKEIIIVLVVCASLLGGILIGYNYHHSKVSLDLKDLKYCRDNYLREQGCSPMFGVDWYELFSFDGGKHWVAVNEDGSILGDAEKVHPGLLEHLAEMDALFDYVRKNGPIDPTVSSEKEILENAGFEVKVNK